VLLPGLLYASGWLLMTTAMMLPTTLPLLRRFERLTSARPDRHRLVALLIAGYLLVWGAFGIAAHLLDAVLHQIVRQSACSQWLDPGSRRARRGGRIPVQPAQIPLSRSVPLAAGLYYAALAWPPA
jgi:hypothetical protein